MDAALALIQSLGINSTVWTQLGLFIGTFIILNFLVFRPYFAAHFERHKRTAGAKQDTSSILASNETLRNEFERKARDVNDKSRLAFEKAKNEALTEQANILGQARESATNQIKISRERLDKELAAARSQLTQEVREIGVIIANKLIGAEQSTNGGAHR
jgi:F0F1-type ATP synthase membrane subunit b/b'